MKSFAFIVDVDGTLTDGKMLYTKDGKVCKAFGCDDWNALEMFSKYVKLHFVTADRKGFPITQRRIEEELGYPLDLVPGGGQERWSWIREQYPTESIIYMGDGILDWYTLAKADFGITTSDALKHVKSCANYVTERPGGQRAVAEAILHLMEVCFNQRPERFCA